MVPSRAVLSLRLDFTITCVMDSAGFCTFHAALVGDHSINGQFEINCLLVLTLIEVQMYLYFPKISSSPTSSL